MDFLSPSKLKRFRACPFQYKHEPFKKTPAMDFGTAIHAAIAAWARGGDPFLNYRTEAAKLGVDPAKEPHAKALILSVIESDRLQLDRDNIVTVESEDGDITLYDKPYFQTEIVPGSWGIRGSMDYVDVRPSHGEIRILDWKTGMTEEEDDLQLACYALAAFKKYPGWGRIETAFYYLERKSYQSSFWTQEDLAGALDYVDRLVKEFQKAEREDKFPQTPHKYCKYCSLRDGCDAFQHLLEKEPTPVELEERLDLLPAILHDLEHAETILKAAESIVEVLKAKRNNILLTHGSQTVDGRVYTAKAYTSSYNYDIPALFDFLTQKTGHAPFGILKLNSSGLDEFKKTLPKQDRKDLEEGIKALRSPATQAIKVTKAIAKDATEEPAEEAA